MFSLVARIIILAAALSAVVAVAVKVPSLDVPACPQKASIQYSKSVPDKNSFPLTQVCLCYDTQAIRIDFTAFNETNFFFNTSYTINDPIYEYEVMETFISRGTNDPNTYLEFEVAPNNVTFNAFIYDPTKIRQKGAPFDTLFLQDPIADGLTAVTLLDKPKQKWVSKARIPLGLFNVDDGQGKGTKWRMNFFRTVVSPEMFPVQDLGAWSVPDEANFHKTPFFGNVRFV